MKNTQMIWRILIAITVVITFITACKKEETKQPPVLQPTIMSLSTLSDTVGAKMIIKGTNFSTDVALDIVKFGDVTATVVSATSTELTIIIPPGVQSSVVTVLVNGQIATSNDVFTVLGTTFSNFSPAVSGIGYPVIVKGNHFSADISKISAAVNGAAAVVSAANDTSVTIIVPDDATTGKIKLVVKGQEVISSTDLQIIRATVTTIAGTGENGYVDGPGNQAQFMHAWGITTSTTGDYYLADVDNRRIRKITPDGTVSTFAGHGDSQFPRVDGYRDTANFAGPYDLAFDKGGNLFVADLYGSCIRKISSAGFVSTLAGDPLGFSGYADGINTNARFKGPLGIVVDNNNNIIVADADNYRIRKITQSGDVTTLAGNGNFSPTDGPALSSGLGYPFAIAVDANNNFYVTCSSNKLIRKISSDGMVSTFAGNGDTLTIDGLGKAAGFYYPNGIAIDLKGNLFVTQGNGKIRMITPAGLVITLAGSGLAASTDGVGAHASFSNPLGITVDNSGALIVMDNGTQKIRKIVIQ